eukprot:CCRYP_000398-RE/>CCRYP_000398-RE protein AED:0.08 eAED:0.07 QI:0/0/0/1/0/0.33/3/0/189
MSVLFPTRTILASKAATAATALLSSALLTPLTIADTVTPSPSQPLSAILPSHTGRTGSICFVVRRPGTTSDVMSGYHVFGTVKEIGVDDTGLRDFHRLYFTYPLYRDDGLVFYNDFFGKRKIKLTTYNPFKLFKSYKEMNNRLRDKKLIQGGVVIFDKMGQARYAYEEETGSPLDIEDILAALKAIRDE